MRLDHSARIVGEHSRRLELTAEEKVHLCRLLLVVRAAVHCVLDFVSAIC